MQTRNGTLWTTLIALLGLAALAGDVGATNLITNGDFTWGMTNWSGGGAGGMAWDHSSPDGANALLTGVYEMYQDNTTSPFAADQTYYVRFQAVSPDASAAGNLVVRLYDQMTGMAVGPTSGYQVTPAQLNSGWKDYDNYAVTIPGASAGHLFQLDFDTTGSTSGHVGIDKVVVSTSPASFQFDGQVLGYQSKELYHASREPAYPNVIPYTAWTGIWKLPNGTIQTDFVQATGPQNSPVITNPVLQSTDNGATWTNTGRSSGYSRGVAVLPNGMMVRTAETDKFGASGPYPDGIFQRASNIFGTQRSTDGGVTWSQPVSIASPSEYQIIWPTVIKPLSDGRLVAFAAVVPNSVPSNLLSANLTKTMFVSSDKGLTWGQPITLMPTSTGVCEESDFVELPNGDLTFISRAQHYDANGTFLSENRLQTMVRKVGDTFVPDANSIYPFSGSGFPCELMTKEGIILDLNNSGSHWSDDLGATWHSLLLNGQPFITYYYPQAVQADDGTIVVVSHNGSDAVYGTIDEPIMLQTFRLSALQAPEPSSMVLLGIGIVGVLTYVWHWRWRAA